MKLSQEVAMDMLNFKYNFVEVLPKEKFGHLSYKNFKDFVETTL